MGRVLRWGGYAAALLAFILVPFALFGDRLDAWAVGRLSDAAAPLGLTWLVIVALLAGDIVLPTPSSVVSTMAGALLGFIPGAVASLIGMSAGCAVGYWIGSRGRGAAVRLVDEEELTYVEGIMERYGSASLALARAVPVLAEASVLAAGLTRLDRRSFFAITLLANAGISLAYAGVGAFAVETSSFLLAFGGAVALPVVAVGAVRVARR